MELYNNSGTPVDLTGWKLQWGGNPNYSSGEFAIPAGTMIDGNGFLLIGGEYVESADVTVPLSEDLDMTLASSNADGLRLLHCGPGVADTVIYGPSDNGIADNPDELLDDNEAIAGLTKYGDPVPEKRSLIYSYNFPPQEFKLKAGSNVKNCHNLDEKVGTIFEIDEDNLILKIKSTNKDSSDSLSISSGGPIDNKIIRKSLYKIADKYLNQKEEKDVAFEILSRALPRFLNKKSGEEIALIIKFLAFFGGVKIYLVASAVSAILALALSISFVIISCENAFMLNKNNVKVVKNIHFKFFIKIL